MKKFLFSFLMLSLSMRLVFEPVSYVFAQKPTPTETPTATSSPTLSPTTDLEKIEKIKEIVASRVAELKLVEKRGIIGKVNTVSQTQITLVDIQGKTRIIDIDELTQFSGPTKNFGISDVKKDDMLAVIGIYNRDTQRLTARFVTLRKVLPVQIEGVVIEIDSGNYQIKVVEETGNSKTIDIQTSTKNLAYDSSQGINLARSGFSRIKLGERVLITGFQDTKDKDLIVAQRLLQFVDIPPSPNMKKYSETMQSETPVSTGSGKKLTPIAR
jgi:hypothetical protein